MLKKDSYDLTSGELLKNRSFHPSILREYDIRGIVGETLFEKDAYWIGRCFGHRVGENAGKSIAVCRDGRLSSPQLEDSLIQGLCDAGLTVYRLGVGPTPMLYFAEYALEVDAAIMITGSHNPPSHNGFKMSLGRKPFFSEDILAFSELVTKNLNMGQGKIQESALSSLYLERVLHGMEFGKELTIAWDPGNGATADILKTLVQRLPGNHTLINAEIDGHFPSHPPDPSDPLNLVQLQHTVIEKKCDLGIAFDGDGDRLAAVDNRGQVLWGDQLLLLFARDLLKREPTATIIADIKTSQGFFDEITRLGGQAIMWKTGHSHIKAKMSEVKASLAGEVSGHFFFKENYYGFDDGIYAAIRLCLLLSHSVQSLSELYEELPQRVSTPEIRTPCNPEKKFQIPQNIKTRLRAQGHSFIDIDGIRVPLKEGWWLLRASNTEDVLVSRCEAYTTEGLEHITQHLKSELVQEGLDL
ncbi:MAG: phosphomannomutase/phosphoglucomutase [Alphaproteobacteria bacterium]|nr:phosphomannomutase/phosphoglucomutase [Alphaproteobacteria bacterium]